MVTVNNTLEESHPNRRTHCVFKGGEVGGVVTKPYILTKSLLNSTVCIMAKEEKRERKGFAVHSLE